jgi:DNA polymerase-3 subunit epsilon
MKHRLAWVWGACFAVVFGASAGMFLLVDSALLPGERAVLREVLSGSVDVIVVAAFIVFLLSGVLAYGLTRTHLAPARRMAESLRLIVGGNPAHRTEPGGSPELRELAGAINALAARHEEALRDVQARVAEARADADQQRNRLGALMSELAQSVIVCNADGRILLYNERARGLFAAPDGDKAAPSYVGLGRAVSTLLEPNLLAHALEQLRHRISRREPRPVAVFMAALPGGALARVQMAPVATGDEGSGGAEDALAGFVLLLEDIGEEVRRAERSDQLLQDLTQSVRSALAGMRAAVENLVNYPDMESARRQQFTGIISEEADRLTGKLDRTMREYSEDVKSQRSLEQIRAADLIDVIRHRAEARLGLLTGIEEVDPSLWVSVDSYSMVQAVCYLASNLKEHLNVRAVRFAAGAAGRHASIDITWIGPTLGASTALLWENEPLTSGGETSPLTFREVLDRHRGEAWYEPGRASRRSYFRLLLPLAEPAAATPADSTRAGRPVYYDFDLFRRSGETHALDDTPLAELTYTVFDTETTGLEPSAGDEIISIGAVRIVNGRLLREEVFDRLVDPRRPLRASSIAIHGIRPEMLEGQPALQTVLPAFHKFCEETVLVGHNVAFDMRFLELKERSTGIRFTHAVLDTLLLSAVLHGNLGTNEHQLEAIARRFGVEVAERHSALGDAMITGEVFLRMLPLLAERGIVSLRQAREACAHTHYARIRY